MVDYDIGAAFGEIEDELISSMIRNLKRHKVEEITEGIEWTQWQVEQLKALDEYKRKAVKRYGAKFSAINDKIESLLIQSYKGGATEQERNILKSIKKGFSSYNTPFRGSTEITGEFFKTNDRKLDSLIKATADDMKRAEKAVLRMADDKYRKIIFNAQVYANTGAGTYAKAVDMATKDFLSAGINCIEYKNGRRVNIRSYADMAIRTANKRAYLQGEGAMRQEWDIHTVILNKRTNACPLCMPFVGKIFIDDVWSGGTAEESEKTGYPLLSEAIAQGLYHPNCQDSHTTYFGDILDEEYEGETDEESSEDEYEEDNIITPDEQKLNEQLYDAEQRQNYCERQVQRFERLERYSLDENNRKMYSSRAKQWREKVSQSKQYIRKIKEKIEKIIGKPIANCGEGAIINIADCKDFNQLEKYLNTAYNISIDPRVKKLDFVTCKEVLRGVETVMDEYPELADKLTNITVDTAGVMCCTGKEICFTPAFFNKPDKFKNLCIAESASGYWVKNCTPASVGVHETAHAVESLLINSNSTYTYDFEKTIAWNECTEAKKIVNQAIKDIKKTPYGKGKRKNVLVRAISSYAESNDSDTMAEAFADVFANGKNANPLSIRIKELTLIQYDKYRRGV